MTFVVTFVVSFVFARTIIWVLDRPRKRREQLMATQRDLIHKAVGGSAWSMDPVSGEQRRPITGGNHLQTQHDAAFAAAWIEPSEALIAKIDRELGITPLDVLDDAPAPTSPQRRTGYTPGMSPGDVVDATIAKAIRGRELPRVGEVRNGWRLERDGSFTQVATPVAKPHCLDALKLAEEMVVEYLDEYDIHGNHFRRAVIGHGNIREQLEIPVVTFWGIP